jgi:beta-glucosidase
VVEPGRFRLFVGGRQPDARSAALAATPMLQEEFEVRGDPLELPW